MPGAATAQIGVRPAAQTDGADLIDGSATADPLPIALNGRSGLAAQVRLAALGEPPGQGSAGLPPRGDGSLATRNALLVGAGVGAVLAYGLAKWWDTGFEQRADFQREGFFGRGTQYGGIDKLGHAYSNYAAVRALTPLLQVAGNDAGQARRLAFWATFGTFLGVEVLDAYSKRYRASWEDMLANTVGSTLGLALQADPALDRLVDLRFAYKRSRNASRWDPAGDYEGQVYLLAFKAEGIAALQNHPIARYLELSVGYAARGFEPPGAMTARRREVQVGLSVNLSRLLADAGYGGQRGSTGVQAAADVAFELVQFPVRASGRASID